MAIDNKTTEKPVETAAVKRKRLREARLAEALRSNLQRRKTAQKGGASTAETSVPDGAEGK